MPVSDLKFVSDVRSELGLQNELRQLDVDTFEVEDLADLGQEAAVRMANCSCSSSCSSSSCSSSSCCSSTCSS